MPSIDSIPVSIPEMDTLDEVREAAVTALLETIRNHYGGTYPPQFMKCQNDADRRILAYKYLRACDWRSKDAMCMVTTTMKFREQNNADSLTLFPCVFSIRGFDQEDLCHTLNEPYTGPDKQFELFSLVAAPYYSAGYHYWDKEGHPILYDFSGRCNVKELLKAYASITPVGKQEKDIILQYHLYTNLIQERLVRYADVKSVERGCRRVIGVTVIMDTEGLHLKMFGSRIVDIVRAIFNMDQAYFPETLHRLLVINCPSVVMHAFGLLRGSLHRNTQRKFVFCSKANSVAVLKKIIDEDKIPKFLGGSCECAGGCVPGIDSVSKGLADVSAFIPRTEDITILAGKRYTSELMLQPGEEVQWEFKCTKSKGGHVTDIYFHASFMPDDELEVSSCSLSDPSVDPRRSPKTFQRTSERSKVLRVLRSERVEMDNGRFVSSERGMLKLVWDNHTSWVHGKHVQLRISRSWG
ncbi:hypothetical protein TraAM80_00846 [Trypanosoma rangeli]|uniref:CRAL-TRIO domain-containing protein n=1 Tax=Trypanosoma rangeli TaxID=5698 RepID=A0A422P1E3_TRYRA|nr:uncharacterized protein TraAM80_00846 [Trypanosoma rangeli]RNF11519.1 hypothetical protein TraAM80_00846 [Trypanosoma rangeli]|eukprot:RNF11519.1 hypothetical protein TraAM80_00846 [Trypanosoma rangeli]